MKLGVYGDYKDFGRLLHMNGVRLKSKDDTKLIWTAFNDAHREQRFGQQVHRRVSKTEWALDEIRKDNFRYWYRVTSDVNQVVTSAKEVAEETKKIPTPK